MYCKRRIVGALIPSVLALGVCLSSAAESGKISIQDWAKKGKSEPSAPAVAASPEASPEPESNQPVTAQQEPAVPAEALLPAIEAETPEPPNDAAPRLSTVQTPQAVLTNEHRNGATIDASKVQASPEPDAAQTAPAEDPARVKTVTEWVAQATPEPTAPEDPAKTVSMPAAGTMNAGQLRTGAGTIDLNSISLDKLYEELKKASPPREELPMALQDAVQLALKNNRDIIVTSYEPLKADGDILAAKGEFDPILGGTYTHSESETTASSQISAFTGGLGSGGGLGNSNLLGGVLRSLSRSSLLGNNNNNNNNFTLGRLVLSGLATVVSSAGNTVRNFVNRGDDDTQVIEQDSNAYEATLKGKIPWGTQYQVKLAVNDEASTYSGNISEYSGGLTLQVTQPLLRGRGPKANLARIRIAKNNREAAENQLISQVMTTVSDTVKAYWDLVGANQQMEVREKSLENAQRLLDINQRRLDIGVGAALEVVQAKASVAQRTSDVVSARNQVGSAEDRLKLLLDLKDDQSLSHKRIVPTDGPSTPELNLDEQESINRAMENRPELKSGQIEIESAELERYRAANEMQMKLDLSGSVFQGARGDKAGVVFDGITERDDNSYSVQVAGEIPITNRAARGQYEKARQSKRQAEDRLLKTQDQVILNVRNAIRQAASSRILLESSGQARALQETNVSAEEKRLKLGVTTSFEVLRTQEDLATAQAQEVQSKVDFAKAMTDLQLAEGTILSSLNVQYEAPAPDKPVGFVRSIVPPAPKAE